MNDIYWTIEDCEFMILKEAFITKFTEETWFTMQQSVHFKSLNVGIFFTTNVASVEVFTHMYPWVRNEVEIGSKGFRAQIT